MSQEDDFLALSKQLYPTGRAFWLPADGYLEGLSNALNLEKITFYNDALSLYNDLLPDNDNFTADDATIWERIYGLQGNASLTLDQRKQALLQAFSFPGSQPAREHYLFIESELQEAGFDVFIYENIFSDGIGGFTTKTPEQVSGSGGILKTIRYGQVNYGQARYGQTYNNKIANSINDADDLYFDIGSDYSSTFFIGGPTLGSFANVTAARHDEFRQLILKLKPTQNVGFLFINYI